MCSIEVSAMLKHGVSVVGQWHALHLSGFVFVVRVAFRLGAHGGDTVTVGHSNQDPSYIEGMHIPLCFLSNVGPD